MIVKTSFPRGLISVFGEIAVYVPLMTSADAVTLMSPLAVLTIGLCDPASTVMDASVSHVIEVVDAALFVHGELPNEIDTISA